MNKTELKKQYEEFLKIFKKEKIPISTEELEKYFHSEEYFINPNVIFLENRFYRFINYLVGNSLRNCLQDLEYFVNLKPSTPISNIEYEAIKDEKDINRLYYILHSLYKNSNLIHMQNRYDKKESIKLIEDSLKSIKEYYILHEKIIKGCIKKINKTVKEEKYNKKTTFESSMYN